MRTALSLRALGVAVLLVLAGAAHAEGARSQALAGTSIPGRDAGTNPVYLALPGPAAGFELALPLGALQYLVSDWANPSLATFDTLPLLNQLTDLSSFLLRAPRSPEVFGVRFSADGLTFSADGQPFTLPASLSLAEYLELPVRFSVAPQLQLGLRPYLSLRASGSQSGGVTVADEALEANLAFAARGAVEAGVAIEAAAAMLLEPLSEAGPSAVGGRLGVLIGLAYAGAEGGGELAAALGGDSDLEFEVEGVLQLGGLLAEGVGVGFSLDLGFVTVVDTEFGPLTIELLAERLGATWWSVDQTTFSVDAGLDEGSTERVSVMTLAPFSVSLGAALPVHGLLGLNLSEGDEAIVAVNLGYALATGVRASIATEIGFEALTVRTGVGYDNGLRAGVGLGFDAGPVGADVALSMRQGLLGGFNLGLGASLRLVWGR
jgi:hypothetical protein